VIIVLLILLFAAAHACFAERGFVCVEEGGYPDDAPWTAAVFGCMVQKADKGDTWLGKSIWRRSTAVEIAFAW
jgi:hypothetical protein